MTTLQNKKVSVIVPNYNYAKYIGKRIDSIVRQTCPVYELIVLDDCSTDNSVEMIKCCATCKRLGIFTTDTGRKYFTCRKKKNMYELHFLDIKCEDWKPSGFND